MTLRPGAARLTPFAWAVLCLAVLCSCGAAAKEGKRDQGPTVLAGPSVPPAVLAAAQRLLGPYSRQHGGGPGLVLALGDLPEARDLVPPEEVAALPSPSAFIVRARPRNRGGTLVVCAGRTGLATGYAVFELLQQLGFAFLHPLKPVRPESLPRPLPALDVQETPRWEVRGTHYHTQHPLELTNLLNGYDAGGGVHDRARWAKALPAWEAFLDWMLAQKQNYVEWMLLGDRQVPLGPEVDPSGGEASFELSAERQARMKLLVQAAHDRGLEVGADVPLVLQQQHALSLLPSPSGDEQTDAKTVQDRVQWLLECGFDHLGTELGSTEFTRGLHASDLVRLLNVAKAALGPKRRIYVKNHCSTGQHADGFPDPRPGHEGSDLNFNYLSYYADPEIVAMPHTVQVYSLKDPAPTYGNANFSDLRDWTKFLVQEGRPVVFYPETAYWVNYDISVPLLLAPVYVKSRVEDALDLDSMPGPRPALGQLNFESGWQWGYWLANSAQAAVSWRSHPDTVAAFHGLLRFLPSGPRGQLAALLGEMAEAQSLLLVRGGEEPLPPAPGIAGGSATGMAYLQGSEGLSDMGGLLARRLGEGAPQPDRLQFSDLWVEPLPSLSYSSVRQALWHAMGSEGMVDSRRRWFHAHLQPLLARMNRTFTDLSQRFQRAVSDAGEPSTGAGELLRDLAVSAELLGLRCGQVLALYEHAAGCGARAGDAPPEQRAWCEERLGAARSALAAALARVPEREANYGLDDGEQSLVSGWRAPSVTAYNFGYLWPVRRLFYWQRDQAIVERRLGNPCFATINDPVELGLRGGGSRLARGARDAIWAALSNRFWEVGIAECFGAPAAEPEPLGAVPAWPEEAAAGAGHRLRLPRTSP